MALLVEVIKWCQNGR